MQVKTVYVSVSINEYTQCFQYSSIKYFLYEANTLTTRSHMQLKIRSY